MNKEEVETLLKEQREYFLAQLQTAGPAYWKALLTGNGLLLAVLSIIVALPTRTLVLWQTQCVVAALFLNLFAILGLLWCFKSERDHHLDLFRTFSDIKTDPMPTREALSKMASQTKTRTTARCRLRITLEWTAVSSVVLSTILVIVIIALARTP
jgi:hypothetical protein